MLRQIASPQGEGPRSAMLVRRLPPLLLAVLAALALAAAARANPITVNTEFDTVDSSDGSCSLREAITAANSNGASGFVAGECAAGSPSGTDTIAVPAGHYVLQRSGANENANLTGDLDLTSDVNIIGAGARTTIVDGSHIDRVFDVPGSTPVTELAGVTIENGLGITPSTAGNAGASGGAVRNRGTLTIAASTLRDNAAGAGATGLSDNTSGGIGQSGGAGGPGGAIVNEGSGTLTVRNSTLTANFAGDGAD